MNFFVIPHDIIYEIFSKLPFDQLTKCTVISKEFNNLVTFIITKYYETIVVQYKFILPTCCHSVKKLCITLCYNFCDELFPPLVNISSLELLNCSEIDGSGFRYLMNLKDVCLKNCQNITDENIKYLNNCTTITIDFCNSITSHGILSLDNVSKIFIYNYIPNNFKIAEKYFGTEGCIYFAKPYLCIFNFPYNSMCDCTKICDNYNLCKYCKKTNNFECNCSDMRCGCGDHWYNDGCYCNKKPDLCSCNKYRYCTHGNEECSCSNGPEYCCHWYKESGCPECREMYPYNRCPYGHIRYNQICDCNFHSEVHMSENYSEVAYFPMQETNNSYKFR